MEAAALCKMADRGEITGAILDRPLALDNVIRLEVKHLTSPVAGRSGSVGCAAFWFKVRE
jgi:phosphate acetyltransferase